MRTQVIGSPPDELEESEFVVTIVKSRGSSFEFSFADSDLDRAAKIIPTIKEENLALANLSSKLRNQFFIKRGGLALVCLEPVQKVAGVITNVVADRRAWEKEVYWPKEWITVKESAELDLPPSDYSDEEEEFYDEN